MTICAPHAVKSCPVLTASGFSWKSTDWAAPEKVKSPGFCWPPPSTALTPEPWAMTHWTEHQRALPSPASLVWHEVMEGNHLYPMHLQHEEQPSNRRIGLRILHSHVESSHDVGATRTGLASRGTKAMYLASESPGRRAPQKPHPPILVMQLIRWLGPYALATLLLAASP